MGKTAKHDGELMGLITTTLFDAHSRGDLELSVEQLSVAAGCSTPHVVSALKELREAGILDETDSTTDCSLSAKGLRIARDIVAGKFSFAGGALKAKKTSAKESVPVCLHPKRVLSDDASVLSDVLRFRRAASAWRVVVEESSLGEVEKERLTLLGAELFDHPAALELFLRALERESN